MIMVRIQETVYVGGCRIRLRFDTGEAGIADLADVIAKYESARPPLDQGGFAGFSIDEWPPLAWPCGFDFPPEMLNESVPGKPPAWQRATAHENEERYES
jgi:hypothetical protein